MRRGGREVGREMPRGELSIDSREKAAATRIGVTVEAYRRERETGRRWCWVKKHWAREVDMVKVAQGSGGRCKECNRERAREKRGRGEE